VDRPRLGGVFYSVQFERDPRDSIDYIVDVLLPSDMLGISSSELAAAIDAALLSAESLTRYDRSEYGLSDETLRAFLVALRTRLAAP